MMSLTTKFDKLSREKRTALIPFLTAGYPDRKLFGQLFQGVIEAGADIVEIGLPFSDPLADGRTIQFSSQVALKNGINVGNALELIGKLSSGINLPLVIMTYFNPVREYGLKKFMAEASAKSITGLIVPDMIVEESTQLEQLTKAKQIDLISLLAPTSNSQRTSMIIKRSRGFVYLVSVTGVTGSRSSLPPTLGRWVRKVRKATETPVCVGFGISTPAQAAQVSCFADGVIIGSAIIDQIRNGRSRQQGVKDACRFIRKVRKGIDEVSN